MMIYEKEDLTIEKLIEHFVAEYGNKPSGAIFLMALRHYQNGKLNAEESAVLAARLLAGYYDRIFSKQQYLLSRVALPLYMIEAMNKMDGDGSGLITG